MDLVLVTIIWLFLIGVFSTLSYMFEHKDVFREDISEKLYLVCKTLKGFIFCGGLLTLGIMLCMTQ